MIDKLRVRNFRCLRDVEVPLGPLNFLIGPNNAGKSSFLQAVETLSYATSVPNVELAFRPRDEPGKGRDGRGHDLNRILTNGDSLASLSYQCVASWNSPEGVQQVADYSLAIGKHPPQSGANQGEAVPELETIEVKGPEGARVCQYRRTRDASEGWHSPGDLEKTDVPRESTVLHRYADRQALRELKRCLTATPVYQLVPAQIARPCQVWPADGIKANGFGLASYLARFSDQHPDRLASIVEALGRLVPRLERVTFPNVSAQEKTILFHEKGGVRFYASEASDGLLLFLAYLAIAYAHGDVGIVLVEEPETGVHARSLQDIVRILRAVARGELGLPPVQVIATSHSPYLLDWCGKEEVIFFLRDEQGEVRVKPLAEVPEIDERIEDFESLGAFVFSVGESACKSPS